MADVCGSEAVRRDVGASLAPQLAATLCVAIALLLNACGFHLRGSVGAALPFQTAHIAGAGSDPALVERLGLALEASDVTLVNDPAQAQVTVKLGRVHTDRRVSAVGADGKVEEYELRYSFEMTPLNSAGVALRPPQRVELLNELLYDENAVLAKGGEEDILYGDMREAAVRSVLLQLKSLPGVTAP